MDPDKSVEATNHFGEAMRLARKEAGVRLADLAEHLGVSVPYLSDVECGRRDPLSNDRIHSAAEMFSTDPLPLLEAAARDRGKVVVPIGPNDNNMKVRAAALLSSNWLKAPHELIERIIQAFTKSRTSR